MKATELLKKLSNKLLGKKAITSAAGDESTVTNLVPEEDAPKIYVQVLDGLGDIQLHENWRN